MAFPQGIDFRSTAGFVTDPASCDEEHSVVANYPRTSAQGNTVGWEDGTNGVRDRNANAGDGAKVAGINFNSSGAAERYRIDLPATGSYSVRAACGDGAGVNNTHLDLYDTTTLVANLVTNHTTGGANQFYDATNVQRTSVVDWVNNNALAGPYTLASTICRFHNGPNPNACVAHVWVEAASGAAATPWANRFSRMINAGGPHAG
jgi:hypothetical protein